MDQADRRKIDFSLWERDADADETLVPRPPAVRGAMTAMQQTRPARPEDWDKILPLLEGMEGVDIGSDATARQRFEHIVQKPDHYLPVAVDGEHLVGYSWVQDYGPHLRTGARTARLHDLFVIPEHRRRGIGAALFLAVKTWAERRGVRYLEWQASRAAMPFYERLGYTGDPCPQPDYPFFEIEFPVDSRVQVSETHP